MFIISVEGNIGSGKSTLIKYMKENLTHLNNKSIIYLPEPVNIWESIKGTDGKNMIQKFYENQERYSFSFQMMAYISRLKIFKDAINENPNAIIITERCLLTDYNIFAKMLYESGKILQEEYDIYKKWFDYFNDIKINHILYIKTDPDVSYERCLKRNRSGENNISFEYLQECNRMHEEWIQQVDDVYTMNGNMNNLMDNYEDEINKIKNVIENKIKLHVLENIMSCIENFGNIIGNEMIDDKTNNSTILSHDKSDTSSILTDDNTNTSSILTDDKSNTSSILTDDKSDTSSILTDDTVEKVSCSDDSIESKDSFFYKISNPENEKINRNKTNGISVSFDISINALLILTIICMFYFS